MDERLKPGGRPSLSFKEIADRILDVDGNTIQPKRGINIIDELTKVTVPVHVDKRDVEKADNFWDYPSKVSPKSDLFGASFAANNRAAQGKTHTSGNASPVSFAHIVKNTKEKVKVNFRAMESAEKVDGADVVIPLSSVQQVIDRYANTLFGYFLGKRLAFPVVDYFAKNNWAKYGLSRLMMNANGFFFFKFTSKEGMNLMLEDGPWLIRSVPIILKEWSPSIKMEKEDIKVVPVWVKMHDVPLAAFTEDGLSLVASMVGIPKMLDTYTASMCAESWGRSSYARALIEVQAGADLKKCVTVAIPSMDGSGYSKVQVKIEYDWEPLRCSSCCVFGHDDSSCPKNPQVTPSGDAEKKNDDFQVVEGKKKKVNNQGIHMKNQKPKVVYRPVVNPKPKSSSKSPMQNQVSTSNPFDILKDDTGNQGGTTVGRVEKKPSSNRQESDEKEVEEVYNETSAFMTSGTHPFSSKAGASTSSTKFSNG
ncbi:hypothetical protein HanRHA438_Chr15g0730871 [Helianthus annuus]|nr:hypothetical protein HanHA300_Chr15g0586001 [Helianthus annuus]KAJ0474966.1 hypothetical protein HanHA89_Chr15g0635791 [Helianthus annuus]KAJ0650521.1 hypothetical protein HanLR1_Chr15g0596701 [Helianthus annuus]KAJ0654274.1 hypothetical protein HanOQP8_Chr15g0593121 [Helianthus annuus]KAJ0846965.1 hypothetical protein HanRHA438_Chr15g0730871 [Helianthus annuus]